MHAAEEKGAPVVLTFRCTRKQIIDTDDEDEEDSLMWQRREVRGFFKRFQDDQDGYRWSVIEYADSKEFARKLDTQLRMVIRSLTAVGSTAPKPVTKTVRPQVPPNICAGCKRKMSEFTC